MVVLAGRQSLMSEVTMYRVLFLMPSGGTRGVVVFMREVILYLAYVWVPRVVIKGEGLFLMSNVPLYSNLVNTHTAHIRPRLGVLMSPPPLSLSSSPHPPLRGGCSVSCEVLLQGYLAHKERITPLGPAQDPRHRPTVGS